MRSDGQVAPNRAGGTAHARWSMQILATGGALFLYRHSVYKVQYEHKLGPRDAFGALSWEQSARVRCLADRGSGRPFDGRGGSSGGFPGIPAELFRGLPPKHRA